MTTPHESAPARRRLRAGVGLAGLTVLAGLLASPLGAGAAGPGAAAAAEDETGKLMLVMDSSGSMADPLSGGGTKIDAAKTALHTVVEGLPADAQVGMRVYGSEVFSRDDAGACTDSERVVDIGTDNRDDLTAAVDAYEPYGETPIGYALQEASKDLGTSGRRSIVLVSDGEPTCPPDPCKVAKQLAADGVDLHIDVVGLDVSGKAEKVLRCVAKNGGGDYYDADSSDDLVDALDELSTRAVRPYEPSGEEISGSAEPDDAPAISSGSYVDELGGADTDRGDLHYRVERTVPGSSVTVTASILTAYFADAKSHAQEDWDGLEVELTGADGSSCATDAPTTERASDVIMITATVTAEDCLEDEALSLRVSRSADGAQEPTPLELVVVEEPPVLDVDSLPEGVDGPVTWNAPRGKPDAQIVGGTSFASAASVTPGAYRGTLVPGEVQVFRAPLEWGQQLAATMTIAAPSGPLVDELNQQGSPFAIAVYSPYRADAGTSVDGDAPDDRWDLYPTDGGVVGVSTAPVTYRNREVSGDELRSAAVAGDYTIVVSLADSRAGTSYEVPFVLRVGITGDPVDPPTYDVPDEETPSASPTDEPTETETAAPSGDEGGDADADDSGSAAPVIALAGGLGLLVLLGGGWLLVRQRRAGSRG